MQRRLVSFIFAIKNTLYKRWIALQGIVDEVGKNPNIWKQRQKLEELDVDSIDQYDDLEDDERDELDGILSNPRKFKLVHHFKKFSRDTDRSSRSETSV